MTERSVSVIVVSRGRPEALVRCLQGLEQLFYVNFEIVVVADPLGIAAVDAAGFLPRLKHVPFDVANISAARNAGLEVAAGDIVAFIDDDAVPEPTWLTMLVAAFEAPGVASAGGYVRGRNGISFQSTGSWVDSTGAERVESRVGVFETSPGHAIKTVGTNCAFLREVLAQIGGFDTSFRFFLDETDVNMRLATAQHKAAIVADAEVHHGFFASAYRTARRVPLSLYEIGASLAIFLRKHHDGAIGAVFYRERAAQQKRIERHIIAGTCEPRDLVGLLDSLEHGFAAGLLREITEMAPIGQPSEPFHRFRARVPQTESIVLQGSPYTPKILAKAHDLATAGTRVSVFLFSATSLYHRVRFENGVWIQSGGLFGRSERDQPFLRPCRRSERVRSEVARVSKPRGLPRI